MLDRIDADSRIHDRLNVVSLLIDRMRETLLSSTGQDSQSRQERIGLMQELDRLHAEAEDWKRVLQIPQADQ